VPTTEHLNPNEAGRDHHSMHSIHANRIERMKPGKRLATLAAKSHVMADCFDGSAGFNPPNDVAVREVLVFKADGGLGKYSNFRKPPHGASRKGQSSPRLFAQSVFLGHLVLLTFNQQKCQTKLPRAFAPVVSELLSGSLVTRSNSA